MHPPNVLQHTVLAIRGKNTVQAQVVIQIFCVSTMSYCGYKNSVPYNPYSKFYLCPLITRVLREFDVTKMQPQVKLGIASSPVCPFLLPQIEKRSSNPFISFMFIFLSDSYTCIVCFDVRFYILDLLQAFLFQPYYHVFFLKILHICSLVFLHFSSHFSIYFISNKSIYFFNPNSYLPEVKCFFFILRSRKPPGPKP